MFVFIKSWVRDPNDSSSLIPTQKAFRIEEIKIVSEVTQSPDSNKKYFYFIVLSSGEFIYSALYDSKEEAEMAQVSAITILNAIELYFERFKHVPEHHATPVMFQVPDPKQKKLVPGKISMFDTPVYTIQL